jgi:hypothetical protein
MYAREDLGDHLPRIPDEHGATGHRNPSIEAQQKSAAHWKREAMRLRPLEDACIALTMPGVKEYVSALGALHHAAHNPIKRGVEFDLAYRTDLSGRAKTNGPAKASGETGSPSRALPHSSPPSHDPRAFAMLRAEERRCKRLAADVIGKLDELVDGESAAA